MPKSKFKTIKKPEYKGVLKTKRHPHVQRPETRNSVRVKLLGRGGKIKKFVPFRKDKK